MGCHEGEGDDKVDSIEGLVQTIALTCGNAASSCDWSFFWVGI